MSESLSPSQRSKIRRLSQPKELAPDEEGGELNIVPFLDIIVNILIFVLATVAVTFTATIDTTPPSAGGGGVRARKPKESLNLTVFVVDDGFAIKASGGSIAAGCQGVGGGITVPKRGAQYDFDGLTACAAKLKSQSEAARDESQVSIAPNPDIDYQTIVNTMDSLRESRKGDPLFTDVVFSLAGKR